MPNKKNAFSKALTLPKEYKTQQYSTVPFIGATATMTQQAKDNFATHGLVPDELIEVGIVESVSCRQPDGSYIVTIEAIDRREQYLSTFFTYTVK